MFPPSDYVENQRLDRYDTGDLNDEEEFSDDPHARRAAEARMAARDRRAARDQTGAGGERRRARMPAFLASEEEDSEDEGRLLGQRRVRRAYDEPAADDEGAEEVSTATVAFVLGFKSLLTLGTRCELIGDAYRAIVRHSR